MFSRRTYSALAKLLEQRGHSGLDTLFHRYSLDEWNSGGNLTNRSLALVLAVEKGLSTAGTTEEITVELLMEVAFRISYPDESTERLVATLAKDGYCYSNSLLVPIVPVEIAAPIESSAIELILQHAEAIEALNHYRQAISTFSEAKYEASNGQIRPSFESFLMKVAASRGKAATDASSALQFLQSIQLIDEKERASLKSTWGLLHEAGPHPGKSDRDESFFRIMSVSLGIWLLGGKLRSDAI